MFVRGHCDTGHFKEGCSVNVGNKHPNWKGGRRHVSRGYIAIYSPDHPHKDRSGYVLEHRLVMEKHLGRYLVIGEEVHHRNHNRSDNRITNLELFTKDKHTQLHVLERPIRERRYWGKNRVLR